MVYRTQNLWVYGLCQLSAFLNNLKTKRFGNCICFRLQGSGWRHLLCWVPQKELTSITGPKLENNVSETGCFRVQVSEGRYLLCWVLYSYLEYRTLGKIHKLSDSGDYFMFKFTIQYYVLIQFSVANFRAVCRHVANS
jgi:hypothetical protein